MNSRILSEYFRTHKDNIDPSAVNFISQVELMNEKSPEAVRTVIKELRDQRTYLKLIASENFCSRAVQASMGNWFTDKYAEGVPEHRFYAGCDNVDEIESLACRTACSLFGADHAYVQPHSGADANLCAYWAILDNKVLTPYCIEAKVKNYNEMNREDWNNLRTLCRNQKLLSMDYYSGSHLTHGYRQNLSAHLFDCYYYKVNREGILDYDEIEKQAMEVKPLILLAGYSAYPGIINFRRMREIADRCGAVLMVDMAHFAGLVAGKVYTGDYDPVLWAHIVTTTTHKTLRGPRGGMILCKQEFAESVDKGCPLVIGGPLPHVMTAKLIALKEAHTPEFRKYAASIVRNSKALAAACMEQGLKVLTGGSENHLILVDVTPFGITGRQAEKALRTCGLTVNRNTIPGDINGPWYTSGIRVGVPAATTLGMGAGEMKKIAKMIYKILSNTVPKVNEQGLRSKSGITMDDSFVQSMNKEVRELLDTFRLYPEIDPDFIEANL